MADRARMLVALSHLWPQRRSDPIVAQRHKASAAAEVRAADAKLPADGSLADQTNRRRRAASANPPANIKQIDAGSGTGAGPTI